LSCRARVATRQRARVISRQLVRELSFQLALENLARGDARQRCVGKTQVLGNLECGDVLGEKFAQRRGVERGALAQHQLAGHGLAETLVGHAEHGGLGHAGC
jgi:hypothetical protein